MRLHATRFWMGVPIVFSCAASAIVAAAAAGQKQPDPPVFGAGVSLVAVPVFVIDKSGRSVAGLTAEDFEVEDGGKRVPIVSLHAVDVDAPITAASQARQAELPLAIQAETPRQFLLLLDLNFSPPQGVLRARKAGMAFVRETLAPGDLVAVATSGPSGLKMLTNFTADHAHAADAISGMGLVGPLGSDPLGLSGPIEASFGNNLKSEEFEEQEGLLGDVLKRSYQVGIRAFIDDLANLVQRVSAQRGRKQIVLLSGGFAESAWNSAVTTAGISGDGPSLLEKMKDLFRKAGQSDVVIHTVSLAGIESSIDISSQTGRNDNRGPNGAVVDGFDDNSGRGSLTALAHNTGGRFILPTNDFGRALREVDKISRHSYIVAFEASEPQAQVDKPRSLKIRARGAGLSVSHRPSYSVTMAPSLSDADSLRWQAAEAISKGLTGGPLRLGLVTMPYRDLEGKSSIQVVLQIDGPALTEVVKGTQLAIQVYGYAMRAGGVLDSMALNTSIDLTKFGPALRSSGLRLVTAFPVSAGEADLRFFARTGASGATGSVQSSVAVPAFTAGELFVSAPMFTAPHAGEVVVPFQPKHRPWIKIPFRLGNDPFVPGFAATLSKGRAREVCVFVWPANSDSGRPLEVTAEIARAKEPALALRIRGTPRVVRDADGFDRYMVTVAPPETAQGSYALRLTFRDSGTGMTRISEREVMITR